LEPQLEVLRDIVDPLKIMYDAMMKISVHEKPTSGIVLPAIMGLELSLHAMKDTRKTNEGKLFTEKLYEGNYLSLQN
jgi:hypothetical protein